MLSPLQKHIGLHDRTIELVHRLRMATKKYREANRIGLLCDLVEEMELLSIMEFLSVMPPDPPKTPPAR
jgi:hypothetical protein